MRASTFCLLQRYGWPSEPVVEEYFTPSPCPLPEGERNERFAACSLRGCARGLMRGDNPRLFTVDSQREAQPRS